MRTEGVAVDRAADEDELSPGVDYNVGAAPDLDELTDLYTSVGWTGYTDHPDKLAVMLAGSHWFMTARRRGREAPEHEQPGNHGRLVGLIRAISDGASVALVQDLLVHPDMQRRGIGRRLLESALRRYTDMRQFLLITDDEPSTTRFYTSCGLETLGQTRGVGFIRYNLSA